MAEISAGQSNESELSTVSNDHASDEQLTIGVIGWGQLDDVKGNDV